MLERTLVTSRAVLQWITSNAWRNWFAFTLLQRLVKHGGLTQREIAAVQSNHAPLRLTQRQAKARLRAAQGLAHRGNARRLARALIDANQKRYEIRKAAREIERRLDET